MMEHLCNTMRDTRERSSLSLKIFKWQNFSIHLLHSLPTALHDNSNANNRLHGNVTYVSQTLSFAVATWRGKLYYKPERHLVLSVFVDQKKEVKGRGSSYSSWGMAVGDWWVSQFHQVYPRKTKTVKPNVINEGYSSFTIMLVDVLLWR